MGRPLVTTHLSRRIRGARDHHPPFGHLIADVSPDRLLVSDQVKWAGCDQRLRAAFVI